MRVLIPVAFASSAMTARFHRSPSSRGERLNKSPSSSSLPLYCRGTSRRRRCIRTNEPVQVYLGEERGYGLASPRLLELCPVAVGNISETPILQLVTYIKFLKPLLDDFIVVCFAVDAFVAAILVVIAFRNLTGPSSLKNSFGTSNMLHEDNKQRVAGCLKIC